MAGQGGLAEEIRVGLEPAVLAPYSNKKPQVHYLDELWVRKPIRQHVWEFACVIALVMFVIAGVMAWRHQAVATASAVVFTGLLLLLLGAKVPGMLHPVWKSWMALATLIGTVMTTIILSLGWTILIIPFALVMPAVGKHVMDLKYDTAVASYWETRDSKFDDFKLLERQF